MKRVTGIGGIFFKTDDPEKISGWYEKHLGIKEEHGAVMFRWRGDGERSDEKGCTVWSLFPKDTDHFAPSKAPFMINYRVDDLEALLAVLREEGVEIDPKREDGEYGRFAWIMDPAGNKIELWEPPKESAES